MLLAAALEELPSRSVALRQLIELGLANAMDFKRSSCRSRRLAP